MSRVPQVLFSIAIDPNALLCFNLPEHKQTHVVAGRIVHDYGILSFGPGDEQSLLQAIGTLVGRPNRVWSGLIEYLNSCHRIDAQTRKTSLTEFFASESRLANSADQIQVAVVAEGGSCQSRKSSQRNKTECVSLPFVDEAPTVSQAMSIETFPKGTNLAQIAERFLVPLARRSTRVTIMDPHIVQSMIEKRAVKPAHAEWLLNVLGGALPPQATISVVGTLQADWHRSNRADNEESIRHLLEGVFQSRDKPLTVELRLVKALGQPLKNRFLWFDCVGPFDVLHNFFPLWADPLKEEFRVLRQVNEEARAATKRLVERYENANIPDMVRVTAQFPCRPESN